MTDTIYDTRLARAETRDANGGALPLHLPRVDVTIASEDTDCPCCKAPMHVIGEEKSERLSNCRAVHQQKSKPLALALKTWLEEHSRASRASPSSPKPSVTA